MRQIFLEEVPLFCTHLVMSIRLEKGTRPIFVAGGEGELSLEPYKLYLEDCSRTFFAEDKPYALIYDGTHMTQMPPAIRRLQADWTKKHEPEIRRNCRGVAFVLPSGFQRGMLTAIHWLLPPPYPFAVFATFAEGREWVQRKM